MKVGASHTPSQTPLPLTSRSPTPHCWVRSHSPTATCAYRTAGWRQSLPIHVRFRCPQARVLQLQPAGDQERSKCAKRYRAVAGVGEEAHSRQRHWCLWSKPVNVETWGRVTVLIVLESALFKTGCCVLGIRFGTLFCLTLGLASTTPYIVSRYGLKPYKGCGRNCAHSHHRAASAKRQGTRSAPGNN